MDVLRVGDRFCSLLLYGEAVGVFIYGYFSFVLIFILLTTLQKYLPRQAAQDVGNQLDIEQSGHRNYLKSSHNESSTSRRGSSIYCLC